jgi:hypothetical protein
VNGRRVVLDWRAGGTCDPAQACSICGEPTIVRSPRGTPCHKTCAEHWVADHPATVEGPGAAALGFRGWAR